MLKFSDREILDFVIDMLYTKKDDMPTPLYDYFTDIMYEKYPSKEQIESAIIYLMNESLTN